MLNNNLDLSTQALETGPAPCHISVDNKQSLIMTANYHTGEGLIYQLLDDGHLHLLHRIKEKGQGPHPDQEHSRIHFIGLTPDRYIITCNLGTDHLTTYKLSKDLKELTKIQSLALPSGSGPRHLAYHAIFKHIFVVNELDSTIHNILYQGCGDIEIFQTISCLPEDYLGDNAAAAIKTTKDGRYIYVSNRGHNSIAIFKFALDGYIHLLEVIPSHGQIPRDFCLTDDEKYLIVTHQDSDNITVFKRHADTGRLEEISHDFTVPEGVCIIQG